MIYSLLHMISNNTQFVVYEWIRSAYCLCLKKKLQKEAHKNHKEMALFQLQKRNITSINNV